MGQKQLSVTPLASLCLGVVRGWINVASKGKGGQIDYKGTAWTRLPADQLKDQLAREFRVEVSTRTVHRALQELSDANLLRRQQRWKHKYRRDYWYAIPKTEEEFRQQLPRTISNTQRTGRNTQTVHNESTDKSVQVLQNHSITHSYQDQRQKNKEKTIKEAIKRCYEHKNPSKPKGFMENEPRNEKGEVFRGGKWRKLKEVWVRGVKHEIYD